MVKVGLQISARLEYIEHFRTCHPNYSFYVKVRCTNCGEASDKWHDITESERIQQNSRNPDGFNFYMKCKMCKRENTIDIIEDSNDSYKATDSEKFKTIVVFDCRGAEPFEFSPRTGWIVFSEGDGETFHNVDLSDDDWVEYDNVNNISVGIYGFQSQFIKLK